MSDETGHGDCGEQDHDVICLRCNRRYGEHRAGDNACSVDDSKGLFIEWSSVNKFLSSGVVATKAPPPAPLEKEIRAECQAIADFLVAKNRAYGNSASEPCRIFAKRVDPLAQIDCRIDDKINRLMRGGEYPGDDTCLDLTGYLILRMIVAAKQKREAE